jgi:hypothetical protein
VIFVACDLPDQRGDMSFDYSAPAALFLAKPAKSSRIKYRRFETAAEALRYTCARPKPLAPGLRLEISASTAVKSNACMMPKTIRCASLSDRAPARAQVRNQIDGASPEDNRRALSSLGSLRRVLTLIRLPYFDLAN